MSERVSLLHNSLHNGGVTGYVPTTLLALTVSNGIFATSKATMSCDVMLLLRVLSFTFKGEISLVQLFSSLTVLDSNEEENMFLFLCT